MSRRPHFRGTQFPWKDANKKSASRFLIDFGPSRADGGPRGQPASILSSVHTNPTAKTDPNRSPTIEDLVPRKSGRRATRAGRHAIANGRLTSQDRLGRQAKKQLGLQVKKRFGLKSGRQTCVGP